MNILIIIPARGGSKGIPRKNLRSLNQRPLIYYSIKAALDSSFNPDVFVTSDDDEILMISAKIGAEVYKRPDELAGDKITLDPVIFNAYTSIKKLKNKKYDYVMTIQPTSPLLKARTIDHALRSMMTEISIDTVISARKEAHLTWRMIDGKYIPNYTERVNRQFLEPYYIETGGFLICRSDVLEKTERRIGENITLYQLSGGEEIDIDTYEDWNLCEYLIRRKEILFVVAGYNEIGLGHVYRALLLANSIVNHNIKFLVDQKSSLAFEKIKINNYEVYIQEGKDILDDIRRISPDMVINDILDTESEYVITLKKMGIKVVNFEDLGTGAEHADLVVNALYPEKGVYKNHYYGPDYFCARDEFLLTDFKEINEKVETVLLTFGGTDPSNLTRKVLDSIQEYCLTNQIGIDVVLGLGYEQSDSLPKIKGISIYRDVRNISEHMKKADIIFTSAGRTVYEIACIGTPAIVMAQNQRELTHLFASSENGFINLGLGSEIDHTLINQIFVELVNNKSEREYMNSLMREKSPRSGKARILSLINNLLV